MESHTQVLKFAVSIALSVLSTPMLLSVHQAYASSCFTDTGGHWAETYICWLRSNGLSAGYADGSFRPDNYITRAEVASLLYHNATTGDTYFNEGTWSSSGAAPSSTVINHTSYTSLGDGGSAGGFLNMAAIPSSLFGRQMQLKGVQLCYEATAPGLTLTDVELQVWNNGSMVASVADHASR